MKNHLSRFIAFAFLLFASVTGYAGTSSGIVDSLFVQSGVGAVPITKTAKLSQTVNVKDFGARGNGITDDTAAINIAISAVNAAGGGTLYAPRGTYITGTIVMKPRVRLIGDGALSTVFKSSHTGAGIKSTAALNGSTSVNTSVENIEIWNTNPANTNGGYVDVAGSYVNLFNVTVAGFKYGVIFDQTELATIRQGNFTGQLAGGAGVWLVNGADYTTGSQSNFTNRITIQESQFNEIASVTGIADDGGYNHSFRDNNFNGCLNGIRVAAGNSISIEDSEFESSAAAAITFTSTSYTGIVVGANLSAAIRGNTIIPAYGNEAIKLVTGVGSLIVEGNLLGNSSAAKITGLTTVSYFQEGGNVNLGGGATISGQPTYQFRKNDSGAFTPTISFGGASVGIAYASQTGYYTRLGNVVTYTIFIGLTSKGSSIGALKIDGLPYAAKSGIGQAQAAPFATGMANTSAIGVLTSSASTSLSLFNSTINYSAALNDSNVTNTTTISITGQYLAN